MIPTKWIELYRKRIKEARTDEELDRIISDIYNDGIDDVDSYYEEKGEPIPWEDLD